MSKQWSDAVKKRDSFTCVVCGEAGVNAHHVLCVGYFKHLQHDLENGCTLCRKCHVLAHRGKFGASMKGKYAPEAAVRMLQARALPSTDPAIIRRLIDGDVQNEAAALACKA